MVFLCFVLGLVAGALLFKTFISDPRRELEALLDTMYEALEPQAVACHCDPDEDRFEAALEDLQSSEDYIVPESWTITGGTVECGSDILPALIFELEMGSGENLGPFLVPFHEGGQEEFRSLVLDGLEEAARAAEEESGA